MKSKEKKCKEKKERAEPPFPLVTSKSTRNFRDAFAAVANLLEGRKNVLVLAGAGQSVSCGIPDFRSRGSGLYSMLDMEEIGLSHPEDLFDYEFFREDPRPFYKFAKALYFPLGNDKRVEPSDSHRFLALLQKKGMLLRVYTQNIDGLEQVAGVSPKKMVYAHGSLQWATCCTCKNKVSAAEIEESILKGVVPRCKQPAAKVDKPQPSSRPESSRRKRSRRELPKLYCNGVLKPGITFFGESLHGNVNRSLEADREKADALIVIGTSLSVAPMSHVIDYLSPRIPRILINRNVVRPPMSNFDDSGNDDSDEDFRQDYVFDAHLLGFCDDVTRALVKQMTGTSSEDQEKGKLLASLEEDDELYCAEEWDSLSLPKDRVFLFPGASRGDDMSDYSYREIAHCDGCSKQISGTVRKCIQCFDYDLCEKCYPKLSKKHYNGGHSFSSEPA